MHRKVLLPIIVLGFIVIGIVANSLGGRTARAGSVATQGWPAAKSRLYDQQQQTLAAARVHPQPKLPEVGPASATLPAPTRQAGIVNMRQGPFSPATFLVRDFWQGPLGSDWLLAYAGAELAPGGSPSRGAIRLFAESPDSRLTPLGDYPAPTGTGPLTVVAANGSVLQLRDDRGVQVSFDLQVKRYR